MRVAPADAMISLIYGIIPFVFGCLVILGALSDLLTFRIPNWVSYGLALLFLMQCVLAWIDPPLSSMSGAGLPTFLLNFGFAMVVFIVAATFWTLRLIGGGDVKFLTAIAVFMGIGAGFHFLVLLAVFAICLAVVLKAMAMWRPEGHDGQLPAFLKRLLSKAELNQLPYAVPIGLAALSMMPRVFHL